MASTSVLPCTDKPVQNLKRKVYDPINKKDQINDIGQPSTSWSKENFSKYIGRSLAIIIDVNLDLGTIANNARNGYDADK